MKLIFLISQLTLAGLIVHLCRTNILYFFFQHMSLRYGSRLKGGGHTGPLPQLSILAWKQVIYGDGGWDLQPLTKANIPENNSTIKAFYFLLKFLTHPDSPHETNMANTKINVETTNTKCLILCIHVSPLRSPSVLAHQKKYNL